MPWRGWWPTKPSDAFKQLGDNLHLGGAAGILGTRGRPGEARRLYLDTPVAFRGENPLSTVVCVRTSA